jgi:hypothetical protein
MWLKRAYAWLCDCICNSLTKIKTHLLDSLTTMIYVIEFNRKATLWNTIIYHRNPIWENKQELKSLLHYDTLWFTTLLFRWLISHFFLETPLHSYSYYGTTSGWRKIECAFILWLGFWLLKLGLVLGFQNPLGLFKMILEISSGFPCVTKSPYSNNSTLSGSSLGHVMHIWTITLSSHNFCMWTLFHVHDNLLERSQWKEKSAPWMR